MPVLYVALLGRGAEPCSVLRATVSAAIMQGQGKKICPRPQSMMKACMFPRHRQEPQAAGRNGPNRPDALDPTAALRCAQPANPVETGPGPGGPRLCDDDRIISCSKSRLGPWNRDRAFVQCCFWPPLQRV